MKNDLFIKNGITIPAAEIEVTFSRSGGPGGQHVNRTETRVTIIWNIRATSAVSEDQKILILQNLGSRVTDDGDVIVHNSESRSQQKNKENALLNLAQLIRKALSVPKKRMKMHVSKKAKEVRLKEKARLAVLKKLRVTRVFDD